MAISTSWRNALAALIVVGTLVQAVWMWFFSFYDIDVVNQTAAAQSLLDGYGLSVSVFNPISLIAERTPLSHFPFGYSVLVAPLLKIGLGYWWSNYIPALIGTVCFLVCWILIAWRLGLSDEARLFIAAYWALLYNPLQLCPPSDIVTVAIFSVGILFCLQAIPSHRQTARAASIAGFCFGACVCFRYAYAVAAVGPMFVLVATRLRFHQPAMRVLAILAVCTGLIAMLVPVYLKFISASIDYVPAGHSIFEFSKLHWDNLPHMAPFPAQFLGLTELTQVVSAKLSSPVWAIAAQGLLWLASIPAVVLLVEQVRDSWIADKVVPDATVDEAEKTTQSQKQERGDRPVHAFFYLTGLLLLVLIPAMTSYFSLLHPMEMQGGKPWTFVMTNRYYTLICGFLMVCLAKAVFPGTANPRSLISRKWVTAFVILVAVMAGIFQLRWMAWAVTGHFVPDGLNGPSSADDSVIIPVIREHIVARESVLYLDDNEVRRGFATMAGAAAEPTDALKKLAASKAKPAVVLLVVPTPSSASGSSGSVQQEHPAGAAVAENARITVYRM